MTRASPTEIDALDGRPSLFSAEGRVYLDCFLHPQRNFLIARPGPLADAAPPCFPLPLVPHVHHRPDAVALLHDVEGLVDAREILAVRDELVHLQPALEVIAHETGQLRATLDATEGAALPHTTGNELECCRRRKGTG